MIWSRTDIRCARKIKLVIVLKKMGYRLRKLEHGNYCVEKFGSLIVKDCFWFWKENKQSGNAIDFFVNAEKMSFSDAMRILTGKHQKEGF